MIIKQEIMCSKRLKDTNLCIKKMYVDQINKVSFVVNEILYY